MADNTEESNPQRWRALGFLALAQLLIVLDISIVNIALPSAQADLGMTDGDRQWVITAYALTFGGLLLLGGRIADMWGRKRTFILGLAGFAAASALGGAAANFGMLIAARALQGAFGALLAPAALALLTVMFTSGKERAQAFGVFGAIAGGGAAVGLLVGGPLTEYLNWRWTLYVAIPFAIIAALGILATVHERAEERNRQPLDLPGAVLGTGGVAALVYAFSRAESDGWGDGVTIAMFITTAVLLTTFVIVERSVKSPLLPMRVVLDRNRGGAFLSLGIAMIGMFGMFLFLTYYFQLVRDYSAVRTGFALVPMVVAAIIGSTQIGARLMTRVPARMLMGPALVAATLGMALLSQLETDSSYAGLLVPAMVLLGLGLGTSFMPAMSLATSDVEPRDTGVASAMINTSQQVGGAIGTAWLNTVASSAAVSYIATHAASATTPDQAEQVQLDGLVHGFGDALTLGTVLLGVAAIIAFAFINARPTDLAPGGADGAFDGETAPAPAY